jgi:hypothetical protein
LILIFQRFYSDQGWRKLSNARPNETFDFVIFVYPYQDESSVLGFALIKKVANPNPHNAAATS